MMKRGAKWLQCPSCGAKDSMEYRTGLVEDFETKDGQHFEVRGLSGQVCAKCGDGFWTAKSEQRVSAAMKAHRDAGNVKAADVASVKEAAEALEVTTQAVHKAMLEGRLAAVYCGGQLLPVREGIGTMQQERAQRRKKTTRPTAATGA